MLSDAAYNSIQSFHSDSAVSFALFLHHLPDMQKQHPPDVLLKAMQVREEVGGGGGQGGTGAMHAETAPPDAWIKAREAVGLDRVGRGPERGSCMTST